ncbi:MAG TPA: GlsB/YeaQ/YmgE family stress response membrane protein [Actinomycetota bacterium]|jgi:uncharacterized membrane protein YeaQ/YmgE (transglycosylase-associated protein family)|nr:GlsB/YeaQ/YmgE family stress response membrane protein [Actinomycetota bacterium]
MGTRKGGTVGDVIVYVVAGLIIGALARLILPGKQSMSIIATLVLGVVAALIGGYLWEAIFPDNDGVAWIGSIIVAVVLLWIYERMVARRTV